MAANKKSFVLYSDQRSIVDMLPDELAGKLLKHIYAYVNDENPTCDNPMINLAFEPIKLQLKRDLVKWSETREGRSKAGKASAEARKNKTEQDLANSTNVNFVEQTSTNSTVNVNANVSVINSIASDEAPKPKLNTIEERKLKFAETIRPYLDKYGKEMITKFYQYWTEPNKSNTKFRQESEKTWSLELRLNTWAENEHKFNKKDLKVIDPRNPKNLPIIY